MTSVDLFNDHARRIAQVTAWHMQGWISDCERCRFLVKETETTADLYDQMMAEGRY